MTSLTRNLRCDLLIKDLGISIIGKVCTFLRSHKFYDSLPSLAAILQYISLTGNLNIGDVEYSGIGVAVVVGGSVMKVPRNSERHARDSVTKSPGLLEAHGISPNIPHHGNHAILCLSKRTMMLAVVLRAPALHYGVPNFDRGFGEKCQCCAEVSHAYHRVLWWDEPRRSLYWRTYMLLSYIHMRDNSILSMR